MTRSNAPAYQTGFANHFATEAVDGALPVGRNSPQRPALGLYAEQLSGAAFTAPRDHNLRSWLYRLRPSAQHGPYQPFAQGRVRSGPFTETPPNPNRMRWNPLPMPQARQTSLSSSRCRVAVASTLALTRFPARKTAAAIWSSCRPRAILQCSNAT